MFAKLLGLVNSKLKITNLAVHIAMAVMVYLLFTWYVGAKEDLVLEKAEHKQTIQELTDTKMMLELERMVQARIENSEVVITQRHDDIQEEIKDEKSKNDGRLDDAAIARVLCSYGYATDRACDQSLTSEEREAD
jgi:hypothetical protein